MMLSHSPEITKLSVFDKLTLLDEIWQQIAEQPTDLPVSPEIVADLDRRMANYERHPEQVTTWETAKARILASIR